MGDKDEIIEEQKRKIKELEESMLNILKKIREVKLIFA